MNSRVGTSALFKTVCIAGPSSEWERLTTRPWAPRVLRGRRVDCGPQGRADRSGKLRSVMPLGTNQERQAEGAGFTGARRAYVAGSLFTEADRAFNEAVAAALASAGFSVYLPQRDAPPATGSGYARAVYDRVRKELRGCDLVVAVCEGLHVDDGTAWEIGYAVARGTPVYGLRTDVRTAGPEERVNLLLEQSLVQIVESLPALVNAVGSPKRPKRRIDPETEIASGFTVRR